MKFPRRLQCGKFSALALSADSVETSTYYGSLPPSDRLGGNISSTSYFILFRGDGARLLDFQPNPIFCLAGHKQTFCPGGKLFWKRAADDLSPNLLDLSDAILLCYRGDSAHLSTQ